MKNYDKLEQKFEYDKELATQLAEAMTELVEIERRAQYLRDIVKRHDELKKFLWGSQDGLIRALHDIEDSHLLNIIGHLNKHDRDISPQLKAEVRSRGFSLEGENGLAPLRQITASSTFISEDNLDLDLDIEY